MLRSTQHDIVEHIFFEGYVEHILTADYYTYYDPFHFAKDGIMCIIGVQ